ncbi:MAG TPA: acetamidase/formamidase family protein, partial [Paracoccaceae bacterium]|nr:acetamidase/formamidase family protein [Paracoccaceae bacterium]
EPGLTMPKVAEMARLSPRYLQRLFRLRETTFTDFVRSGRLEMARQLLLQETGRATTIAEIGFRCGFGSVGNFTRLFRETFGMSPRDYRANARKIETRAVLNRGRPAGVPDLRPWDGCTTLSREALLSCQGAGPASRRHHVAVDASTVHWGFFSHELEPVLRVRSGSEVTIETLTQHASDDWERMIEGDPGAESVFHWGKDSKNVERRGAGPMDASVLGRGAGEGFGVHIMTGPIHVDGAEPGDILEVNILDITPRPSANPAFSGRSFASNASTWWGYHYADFIDSEDRREVVTIFEVEPENTHARALYSFRWSPQTDPYGVIHETIDYPGVPVDHGAIQKRWDPMPGVRIPLRPHFGVMAVMPKESALVDSIPPGNFGGNLDNWRAGKGSTIYLPVAVKGALFSVGDGHLTLGDGEVNGTGLECSLTGTFRFVLHKQGHEAKRFLCGLAGPLIETHDQLVLHGFSYPNYLRDLGQDAQAEIYKRSCLDRALRSAFQFARKFLMDGWGLDEDSAITVLSTAADFGVTQVADGNWGVHVAIPKDMLPLQ